MKNYNTFILELVRNEKNIKWFLRKLLTEVRDLDRKVFSFKSELQSGDDWELEFTSDSKYKNDIEKIVKHYQRELLKSDTYISYSKHETPELELPEGDSLDLKVKENGIMYITYHLYIKDLHIGRVKPTEFVYHTSSKTNKESIEKYGLIPKENKNYAGSTSLNHPPMIFATLEEPLWQVNDTERNIWEIDTKKINSKWWYDPNMHGHWKGKEMIITFDPISPDAIKDITGYH